MPSTADLYQSHAPTADAPARQAAAVTPNDSVDLSPYAKALFLGGGGDVVLIPAGGETAVTLKAHGPGYVAVQARRVLATGTTAQHIVALFD